MKLFFSVQLGHLKLSGYGLLSTQGVQNRSQNCWIVSQSEVMLQYMRDPGAPAELGPKGVKLAWHLFQLITYLAVSSQPPGIKKREKKFFDFSRVLYID